MAGNLWNYPNNKSKLNLHLCGRQYCGLKNKPGLGTALFISDLKNFCFKLSEIRLNSIFGFQ